MNKQDLKSTDVENLRKIKRQKQEFLEKSLSNVPLSDIKKFCASLEVVQIWKEISELEKLIGENS